MNFKSLLYPLALVTVLVVNGCSEQQTSKSTAKSESTNESPVVKVFSVRGVVKEIHADKSILRIKHEDITNYMSAMTMDFNARQPEVFTNLTPEDPIIFQLHVTADTHWIDNIHRDSSADAAKSDPVTPNTNPAHWRLVRDVEPLDIGDAIPNYDFTNELGKAVSLKDLRGKVYAFTFMFTRCPLPDFCPRMSSNFEKVQQILSTSTNHSKPWHLFSITMDPEYDTPLVLKSYAARFRQNPEHWSFLTAPLIDITAIGEQFGLEFYRPDGSIAHNLRTVVIGSSGKVQNIIIGNTWKPEELAEMIQKAEAIK
ncbi:hypothetical protein GC207_11785 [bacterium]|nr:hypothetical protein [bacterium]